MEHTSLSLISFIVAMYLILAATFSTPAGASSTYWVTGDQIIPQGSVGEFDSEAVGTSSVIKVDGEYKLWYEAYNGSVWSIGYANSSDGKNWTKQGEVYNISVDPTDCNVGTADPCVRYIDGIYKMWYAWKSQDYGEGGHDYWTMGYAESSDGVHWVNKTSQLTWNPTNKTTDNWGCEWYAYVVDNSTIWMYFVMDFSSGNNYRAISTDGGLTWQQEQVATSDLDKSKFRAPCVLQCSNGSYTMYTGCYDIYQRWSNDGINWGDAHLVIDAPDVEWENNRVWDPRVFPVTDADNPTMNVSGNLSVGTWYMVYTGNTGMSGCTADMKCGLATLQGTTPPNASASDSESFGISLPIDYTATPTPPHHEYSIASFGISLPIDYTAADNNSSGFIIQHSDIPYFAIAGLAVFFPILGLLIYKEKRR